MARKVLKDGFYSVAIQEWNSVFDIPVRYKNVTPIKAGGFGQVVAADDVHPCATVRRVAIKKIKELRMHAEYTKRAYREMHLLNVMNHDNIISLLDAFTPNMSEDEFVDLYLVTELMGSDLHEINQNQKLGDEHVQFLIYQILRGLKYLHSGGIMHRDLKPSNIAVNENCDLKILDFGLSRQINLKADFKLTAYVSTRWYRAPEVLLNWMHYNENIDVWSVGCIMAELLLREPLFKGKTHIEHIKNVIDTLGSPSDDVLQNITSAEARAFLSTLAGKKKRDLREVFVGCTDFAIDLLSKLLDLNPLTRISVEGALAHPYLQLYSDVKDEPILAPPNCDYEDKVMEVADWISQATAVGQATAVDQATAVGQATAVWKDDRENICNKTRLLYKELMEFERNALEIRDEELQCVPELMES